MLYSINSSKYVKKLPHKEDFDIWMKKLAKTDYDKIVDAINLKISMSDVNTSSWIPGNEWNGVYKPIEIACGTEASGLFFGLILFDILMKRRDAVWGFDRFENKGVPIKGMTYFILHNPPEL